MSKGEGRKEETADLTKRRTEYKKKKKMYITNKVVSAPNLVKHAL